MTARKLIEEAKFLMADDLSSENMNIVNAMKKLNDALSLLPDADESASNWQEFDPKREETWPKPKEMPEWFLVCRSDCGVSWDTWGNEGWESDENGLTLAWMPLPPPYHPKEDVEIKP